MKKLNMAVLGAGVFGNYHAGKIAANPDANLVGIIDFKARRVNALSKKYNARPFSTIKAALPFVDAIIIATPASLHAETALEVLRAGKHVLVEKPLASDLQGGQAMVDMAREKNVILQVGHQERFVLRATGLLDVSETPIRIETKRMGPYAPRNIDVSVTMDLMVHDIDMVLKLMGPATACKGQSIPIYSTTPDTALGFLEFEDGRTARLEASRVEENRTRTMRLVYPSGEVNIDFNEKTLKHNTPFDLNIDFGQREDVQDSLGAADNAFIRSCLYNTPVAISGEDGLAALRVAIQIDSED